MAGKTLPKKKVVSRKRKRATEDGIPNKRINSMFRTIDQDEYEMEISQKLSQTGEYYDTSQKSMPDSSAETSPSAASAPPSGLSVTPQSA